jgi:hypothetical protein
MSPLDEGPPPLSTRWKSVECGDERGSVLGLAV